MTTIPFHDSTQLEAYCLPFIRGEKKPRTALETMASRYVAYTRVEVDYLLATHDPKTRAQADRRATEEWARRADWQSLEIVSTEAGGPEDERGVVEFVARYNLDGQPQVHRERSEFRRIDGEWYFIDGKKLAAAPIRRTEAKVGRNDPCTCGSGKKYKKCCGATA
jgi:SEC-C motif-containing protein